jgi:4-hydroxy-tetrahydrodipicolinate reductase
MRICLLGLGKTGKEIARFLSEQEGMQIVAAVCSPNSQKLGVDLGEILGVEHMSIFAQPSNELELILSRSNPDVILDFTTPKATLSNLKEICRVSTIPIVIGTTGFSRIGIKKLRILARKYNIGVVYAPNITLGVNVLMLLSNVAACILNNYDFQIIELHHKYKKDSPSGTAVKIDTEIQRGLKSSGNTAHPNRTHISAVRAGGIVGKHKVMIVGDDDQLEISHESFSRKAFAQGAIKAIYYIRDRKGYHEMKDVLHLQDALNKYT